jgi:hypothetical protein
MVSTTEAPQSRFLEKSIRKNQSTQIFTTTYDHLVCAGPNLVLLITKNKVTQNISIRQFFHEPESTNLKFIRLKNKIGFVLKP